MEALTAGVSKDVALVVSEELVVSVTPSEEKVSERHVLTDEILTRGDKVLVRGSDERGV